MVLDSVRAFVSLLFFVYHAYPHPTTQASTYFTHKCIFTRKTRYFHYLILFWYPSFIDYSILHDTIQKTEMLEQKPPARLELATSR